MPTSYCKNSHYGEYAPIFNHVESMEIERFLRERWYRMSKHKRELFSVLWTSAWSFESLKSDFISKTGADSATFYRMVKEMKRAWAVHSFEENGEETVILCSEIGKSRSASYEITHCHSCGHVSDVHPDSEPLGTVSKKEIHVPICPNCPK